MTVVVCDKKGCAHYENGVCDMEQIYFQLINDVLVCVDDTDFVEESDHIADE